MSHPRSNPTTAHQQRLHELRHRLRYAQTDQERTQVRNELDFWMRHRSSGLS